MGEEYGIVQGKRKREVFTTVFEVSEEMKNNEDKSKGEKIMEGYRISPRSKQRIYVLIGYHQGVNKGLMFVQDITKE